MLRTILITTTTAALTVLGIAGCATGPTTRTQVCQQFDELGQQYLATNGFSDSPVFAEAGDLANTASRYLGFPDLNSDANALSRISNSNSTSGLELIDATSDIAQLCGHPLGMGTTDFNVGNAVPGNIAGGNSGDQQYQDSPTTTEDPPTYQYTPTTTQNPAEDEASAQTALQQQLSADQPAVEALIGQWVPQLSSKTYGMVANGVTYDYRQIWADFESISQQHPGALLLWSGNYRSFQLADYYVTILPDSYPSGSQAASWCTGNGLDANDCYAKLISHTAGPKGSTVDP